MVTTPDDFPRHRPPTPDPDMKHPGKGVLLIALYFGGALVILAVFALIAILVFHTV